MIIEHEIIEQIQDEPNGRSVKWVCNFIESCSINDPITTIGGMWHDKYVAFEDTSGSQVPAWRCENILRNRELDADIRVIATEKGLRLVHGSGDQ